MAAPASCAIMIAVRNTRSSCHDNAVQGLRMARDGVVEDVDV